MTKEYKEALTEVNEILKYCDIELVKRIPYKLKKFIEENMSLDYKFDIDLTQPMSKQKIKKETENIISMIYRDYICTKEQKEKIVNYQNNRIKLLEEENREKHKLNNLFKDKKRTIDDKKEECTDFIVQEKQKFIKKLLNFIKNKFNKRSKF